jgi:NADH-quinone oxidoreductase subunit N
MWTPDVYQGAPTPVTAFMSVGTKAAAFAAFSRVLIMALPTEQPLWGWALAILAVLTMTLGNLAALRQTSLKRMLAYSSIAHAGYILVGLTAGTAAGADAANFYLFTYAFMNIGAFAVVMVLEKAHANDALQNRAIGLGQRWPMMALVMAIFMLSLSGVPPLAGFFGKLLVFKAAVDGGWAWLAVVGMLNSAIGAYYYLRVTVAMYFEQPNDDSLAERRSWGALNLGIGLAAVFTVAIGLYPGLWTGLFQAGLAALGG